MTEKNISPQLVGVWFQAIAFLASLALLTIFLTLSYSSFANLDPAYPIEPNQPTAPTHQITTGFHLTQFNKFYMTQNIFELIGTIWFAYDPKIVSLDIIKKFSIYNGALLQVSEPAISKKGDQTLANFRIQIRFNTILDYHLFPMDDHCINIIVTNTFLPKDIILATSNQTITFDSSLELPGWDIINRQAKAGYTHFLPIDSDKSLDNVQQKVVFSLFLEHNNPMLTLNIMLTLLLLLFTTILTFSSDQDSVLIVTVGLVALIGYRFVLQTLEPLHINYFTLADYMYLFALISVILTLFGGIFTRERGSSVTTKKWIIGAIYALFVGGCSLLSYIL